MGDRSIRDAINQITGNHLADKVYSVDATVVSVDSIKRVCTCQLVGGKANNTFENVRLMASVDDGFLLIPALDSNVCIIFSDFTDPYISQYGEIDKVIIRGGDLGGLISIEKQTTKLNKAVLELNTELIKIQTAISSLSGTYIRQNISTFDKTDFENKNVTHG
jgi:hypothetical protein